jgi:hypothetical protein
MSIAELPYVEGELNYLQPMTERPRYYAYETEPGEVRSNMTTDPHVMHIHNMRPIVSELDLDRQGFALVEQKTAVKDFWNDDEVRRVYYPEASVSSPNSPVRAVSLSSTICNAAACRGRRTGRPVGRASRQPASMSTIPRAPARSGSATCCPTKPKNC